MLIADETGLLISLAGRSTRGGWAMLFTLGKPTELEESLTCEFKEVRGHSAVHAIGKVVDEYVVAYLNEAGGSIYWGVRNTDRAVVGVHFNEKARDELNRVVGQKVDSIAPHVPARLITIPFHPILGADGIPVHETFVVEVHVHVPTPRGFFLTGSGEAYRKTIGGIKKLTGAELLVALLPQLQVKLESKLEEAGKGMKPLSWLPSVQKRAQVVQPLLEGARVLWIDDHPSNNIYERTALAAVGVTVDLAMSTGEALHVASALPPDVVISDIDRGGNPVAGLEGLSALRRSGLKVPFVFYVSKLDETKPTPPGAFAITNRPDSLLHYVFDLLERREPNS
jgi:CheY-like chemotaxis protein